MSNQTPVNNDLLIKLQDVIEGISEGWIAHAENAIDQWCLPIFKFVWVEVSSDPTHRAREVPLLFLKYVHGDPESKSADRFVPGVTFAFKVILVEGECPYLSYSREAASTTSRSTELFLLRRSTGSSLISIPGPRE